MKYSIDISKITLHPNFVISHLSLFFLSLFVFSDTTNKIAPVTETDLNNALSSDYYANKSNSRCVLEFEEMALHLMLAHNLTFPTNIEEARQLYDNLLFIYCIKQLTHCKLCLLKRMLMMFIIYFTNSFALPLGPFLRLIQVRSFKLVLCFVN